MQVALKWRASGVEVVCTWCTRGVQVVAEVVAEAVFETVFEVVLELVLEAVE